jgi:Superfamily I DNA and RNA helicases
MNLDAASDLQKIQIIKTIIDELPVTNPLKRNKTAPYYELQRLASLYADIKREGWSEQYLLDRIDAYIEDLPNRKGFVALSNRGAFKKGDIRYDKIEAEKKTLAPLKEAVKTFRRFQEIMSERNLYDFDDMILWVNKLFSENESVLAGYKENFQMLLVDEYQDTSGSQNTLLEHFIRGEEQANIFVVGDDDQSIYRFQGANIENIIQFRNNFSGDLKEIVLKYNYRSTQAILDASGALISNNMQRLCHQDEKLSKQLLAQNPERKHIETVPEIHVYENQWQELIGVCESVADLIKHRQIPPGEIAIIYSQTKQENS